MTTCESPELQSVNKTLTSTLPREMPLTTKETEILRQIDPKKFNTRTTIDLLAFEKLTKSHPNWPFIEYLIKESEEGLGLISLGHG